MPKGEEEPGGQYGLVSRGEGSSCRTWDSEGQLPTHLARTFSDPPCPLCARVSACTRPGALPTSPCSLLSACPGNQDGSGVLDSVLASASCSLSRLHFVPSFCQRDAFSSPVPSLWACVLLRPPQKLEACPRPCTLPAPLGHLWGHPGQSVSCAQSPPRWLDLLARIC